MRPIPEIEDPEELLKVMCKFGRINPSGLTLQKLAGSSPLGFQVLMTGALYLGGALSPKEWQELSRLTLGLILVFIRARAGLEPAREQIDVLERFIFPRQYKLVHKVKELAGRYRRSPLARGWELRELMCKLASVVVPANGNRDTSSLLKDAVIISTEPHAKEHPLYDEAVRNWKRGSTLASLAIRIYLERETAGKSEEDRDSTLSERSLKRDLKEVEEWEKADPLHNLIKQSLVAKFPPGEVPLDYLIPSSLFSESTYLDSFLAMGAQNTDESKSK